MSREYTFEEIRERYLQEVRTSIKESDLETSDTEEYTWRQDIFKEHVLPNLTWSSQNGAVWIWPPWLACTVGWMELLAKSEMVWGGPWAAVSDGQLVVHVVLVDGYTEQEVEQ